MSGRRNIFNRGGLEKLGRGGAGWRRRAQSGGGDGAEVPPKVTRKRHFLFIFSSFVFLLFTRPYFLTLAMTSSPCRMVPSVASCTLVMLVNPSTSCSARCVSAVSGRDAKGVSVRWASLGGLCVVWI
jgi:hypothetical protein